MKNKLRKQKGFTLMEMLIVVAIIVILVMISIPLFTGQLEKARVATDDANLRAAKAAAIAEYLMPAAADGQSKIPETGSVYYDIENGEITTTAPAAYGQSTENDGKVIAVSVGTDGNLDVVWVAASGGAGGGA